MAFDAFILKRRWSNALYLFRKVRRQFSFHDEEIEISHRYAVSSVIKSGCCWHNIDMVLLRITCRQVSEADVVKHNNNRYYLLTGWSKLNIWLFCNLEFVFRMMEHQSNRNADRRLISKRFEGSGHVAHYKMHPKEYKSSIQNFLKSLWYFSYNLDFYILGNYIVNILQKF